MSPLRARPVRFGFTMVEAMVASIIVAAMLVAALNTAGASAKAQSAASRLLRGQHMAAALLSEVESAAYSDPDLVATLLGIDASESPGDRRTFDDVDDYSGYSQSDPTMRDGTPMSSESGWAIAIQVSWVSAAAPGDPAGVLFETGLKRIEVRVMHEERLVATVASLKSRVGG